MPIYEYECVACHHTFDKLQKISEAALTDCPNCGKPELQKLVSAAGFQLKGSGWYVTDFRDGGKKPEAKAETKSQSEAGAAPDTKLENKATTTESTATPKTTSE